MPILVPKVQTRIRAIRLTKALPAQRRGDWLLIGEDDSVAPMTHAEVVSQFKVEGGGGCLRASPPRHTKGSFSCDAHGKRLTISRGIGAVLYALGELEGQGVREAKSTELAPFLPPNITKNVTARLTEARAKRFVDSMPSGDGKAHLWALTNEGRFITKAYAKALEDAE